MTFTFTIDCFPAYTKFDKTHKVLAELITIDPDADTHPYSNKNIIGHGESDEAPTRTKDSEVNDWYTKSIFGEAAPVDEEETLKP